MWSATRVSGVALAAFCFRFFRLGLDGASRLSTYDMRCDTIRLASAMRSAVGAKDAVLTADLTSLRRLIRTSDMMSELKFDWQQCRHKGKVRNPELPNLFLLIRMLPL